MKDRIDRLNVFTDADYGSDIKTRRSISGVVCTYMGGAISSLSQKQKAVALSTTEAEFVAACEGAKEAIWEQRLLQEITILEDVPSLNVDNLSALKLINNLIFHKRSKHIVIKFYFVRERYLAKQLNIKHLPGSIQVADILTKPLPKVRFQQLRKLLGLSVMK